MLHTSLPSLQNFKNVFFSGSADLDLIRVGSIQLQTSITLLMSHSCCWSKSSGKQTHRLITEVQNDVQKLASQLVLLLQVNSLSYYFNSFFNIRNDELKICLFCGKCQSYIIMKMLFVILIYDLVINKNCFNSLTAS